MDSHEKIKHYNTKLEGFAIGNEYLVSISKDPKYFSSSATPILVPTTSHNRWRVSWETSISEWKNASWNVKKSHSVGVMGCHFWAGCKYFFPSHMVVDRNNFYLFTSLLFSMWCSICVGLFQKLCNFCVSSIIC